ncbi:hypothetical protein B0H17DRAFT_1153994 [Mycena rosella]|uniref:Uncharacterized protein n=1 Tax=Mycena rosella TaxID=1033263 RepID=A0AAD7F9G4_MYCRO|nr:hypothetical protein B0H17DRAFT_1153994 [Mycena rosella]
MHDKIDLPRCEHHHSSPTTAGRQITRDSIKEARGLEGARLRGGVKPRELESLRGHWGQKRQECRGGEGTEKTMMQKVEMGGKTKRSQATRRREQIFDEISDCPHIACSWRGHAAYTYRRTWTAGGSQVAASFHLAGFDAGFHLISRHVSSMLSWNVRHDLFLNVLQVTINDMAQSWPHAGHLESSFYIIKFFVPWSGFVRDVGARTRKIVYPSCAFPAGDVLALGVQRLRRVKPALDDEAPNDVVESGEEENAQLADFFVCADLETECVGGGHQPVKYHNCLIIPLCAAFKPRRLPSCCYRPFCRSRVLPSLLALNLSVRFQPPSTPYFKTDETDHLCAAVKSKLKLSE